jgi:hypothetical protein
MTELGADPPIRRYSRDGPLSARASDTSRPKAGIRYRKVHTQKAAAPPHYTYVLSCSSKRTLIEQLGVEFVLPTCQPIGLRSPFVPLRWKI